LPVPPSYQTHNAATESKDLNSLFALRHSNQALLDGRYTALNEDDANVLSYLRKNRGKAVLVALNMSDSTQKPNFDLSKQGLGQASLKPLIASSGASANGKEVTLEPFGFVIAVVTQ
jgi:glycosidase